MVTDYGPGHDSEAAFQRAFKEAGGEIVGSVRFPVANPDFSAFVQRAKDMNPECIYIFIPGGAQPAALGKALAERGIDPNKTKMLGSGETTAEQALKSMGDASLGIISAWHYDYKSNAPRNVEFVKIFNEMHGRNPDFFSIGGYDGMHAIYETLKKTGGKTDGDSLIAAAKGMEWDSPRGPMSIDPRDARRRADDLYPAGARRSAANSSTSRSTRSRTSRIRRGRAADRASPDAGVGADGNCRDLPCGASGVASSGTRCAPGRDSRCDRTLVGFAGFAAAILAIAPAERAADHQDRRDPALFRAVRRSRRPGRQRHQALHAAARRHGRRQEDRDHPQGHRRHRARRRQAARAGAGRARQGRPARRLLAHAQCAGGRRRLGAGQEVHGGDECGRVDHHDQVALHGAHLVHAAAAQRAARQSGPTRTGCARSIRWWRILPPATTPKPPSRARSRRPAARSSARCAIRSPIRTSRPSCSAPRT